MTSAIQFSVSLKINYVLRSLEDRSASKKTKDSGDKMLSSKYNLSDKPSDLAKEVSPVITSPPNFCGHSPPSSYKSVDNFFNDYNEESTEVEEASLNKIDTFFQGLPNVKDAKLKSRKRRSTKDTSSKSVK
ncbi:14508_t:CDS:2 [Funneliformis mosseae]|uniref:14508_t:CDS:1 n=1 Tax=Funneliformis mosseae TaxID=27381 RepID=A0A9N9BST6_FUNMO|nr:14508_t:CDS:2 [Funneliformis mosseae]